MPGTNARLRFYLWCDSSALEVDYAPPIADYPDFPRKQVLEVFQDNYKSALGSNYWRYFRGTSFYWEFDWNQVSDECMATMGLIVGSSIGYSPHIGIWEGQGLDGITLASLYTVTGTNLVGTFFPEISEWAPREEPFGLWNFTIKFRKEA